MSPQFISSFCIFLYAASVTIGAFTGGAWATFGIGGAILLYLTCCAAEKKILRLPCQPAMLALLTLALWAAEIPFSIDPALSFKFWIRLGSIFLPLLLLSAPQLQEKIFSRRFIPVVATAMGLGALGLGAELLSGGFLLHHLKNAAAFLTEYNRGIAHVVILSFALFAGLFSIGKKKEAALLALILLFPASLTESHTAKLALVLGSLCAAAAFVNPLFVRRGLSIVCIALMGWPIYAQRAFLAFPDAVTKLHDSFRHRLEIWDYLSYRIQEKPLFGWGLGTTHLLDFTQPHAQLYRFAIEPAPHAHNFVVQLWVETGLAGLLLGLAFLLFILRHIQTLPAQLQPFALGGFTAAVTVSLFGFDFWTDALWSAFALTLCAFAMLARNIQSSKNPINA